MDYSGLSQLLSCPRQYQHSSIEKLAPVTESISRRFGDAWHGIMYEHGKRAGDPLVSSEIDVILAKLGWQDPIGDYRSRDKLIRGYQRYIERYSGHQSFKYVQQEKSFKRLTLGTSEPWEGRKDAVVVADSGEGKGAELWVVDYKTTSMLRGDWVDFYRNSNQFKGYYLDAKAEWPELAGVIVDVYHATKGAKSGKTFEEIEGNRFYRLFIRYEDFTLREAEADFAIGVTASKLYKELGYYPKNTSACHQFGVACPFLELCTAPSAEARDRLRATYGVNTFDPHAPVGV